MNFCQSANQVKLRGKDMKYRGKDVNKVGGVLT
jgi:hypothetical protein